MKKAVLKNFAKFTAKHLCWSPFLIKLQDWRMATSVNFLFLSCLVILNFLWVIKLSTFCGKCRSLGALGFAFSFKLSLRWLPVSWLNSVSSLSTYRSSHRRCLARKGVLVNFTKFTGKHLRHSLFFNKVGLF